MTAKANGYFAPPRDWAALQRAYENHVGPLEPLAQASNISPSTLQKYARDRDWVRLFPQDNASSDQPSSPAKKSRSPAQRLRPAPSAAVASPAPTAAPPPTPRALRKRLLGAFALKLDKMETDMSASKPLSPIDHERHTRALGTLAKSVEKLNDIGQPSGGRTKPATAPETAASDEDKLRRELAARIKRLREQLER